MVLLRLDSLALSRSRFALSPFAETLSTMIVLSRPCTEPWLTAWHARHHAAFRARLDADPFTRGLVMLCSSTKYLPDHLVLPPPGGMGTTLESELVEVARVPDTAVRSSLVQSVADSWEHHDLDWLTGHAHAARSAELFREVWQEHVAADWPGRRAMLERDVTYRAGLLAAHGWPRALHQMKPAQRLGRLGHDPLQRPTRSGPHGRTGRHALRPGQRAPRGLAVRSAGPPLRPRLSGTRRRWPS